MRIPILVSILLLGACVFAPAVFGQAEEPHDPSKETRKRRVAQWVDQLDARTRRERVRAVENLLQLGPDILPLLPPPERLPSVSAREAVREIRNRLEREKAETSVRASQVTLQGRVSVAEALEAIAAQTDNPLDSSRVPQAVLNRSISVDWSDRPFWRALDDLAARTGLRYEPDGEADRLSVTVRDEDGAVTPEAAIAYSGAFRLAARSAEGRPLLGDEDHRLLRVHLSLLAEPRLRPLFLKVAAAEITARSADGRTLSPFTPQAQHELPLRQDGGAARFHLDYRVPAARRPSRISLKGEVSVQVAAGEERFTFQDFSQPPVTERNGGVTVTLQQADFSKRANAAREAVFRLAVSYDAGGPAFESYRTWIFHNQVFLLTDDGRRLDYDGPFRTAVQGDGAVAVEYRFEGLSGRPSDYRLVYLAPTLIVTRPIDFELTEGPVRPPAAEPGGAATSD